MTDQIHSNQQASRYGQEGETSFQQAQPSSKYPHLEALPMFPLESEKAEAVRQKMLAFAASDRARIKEIRELTTTEQIGKAYMSATGAGLVDMRKVDNAINANSARMNEMVATQMSTMVLTRWVLAPDAGGEPLFVDILENRSPFLINFYVKASRAVEIKIRGKFSAKLKSGGSYSKNFNRTPIDDVVMLIGKQEVPLEILLRMQRPISPVEVDQLRSPFVNKWVVPIPA